ncbi:RDD family protein [Oleiagrimonas sp. C23AA]|uniref:RDD family protein n=1 Tax=Oleiagrimonas sp. C23AA TaxID=2719047 RepID=UPI00141EB60C|nr:RDD family protein [Oleiagrimonas sp. C23AA]NII10597.1 RDD family protein [Oleiagrimonas sp. C23AA]
MSGVAAEAMWPALARWFKLDEASFSARVRERVPMSLTPGTAEQANAQAAELEALGAQAVALEEVDARRFWIRHGGRTCGPVSAAFAAHALSSGQFSADSHACVHGGSQWQRLDQALAAGTRDEASPPPVPPVASATARATSPRLTGPLPVHDQAPDLYAGFWRRAGAYLIDGILLTVACGVLRAVVGFPGHMTMMDWSGGDFHHFHGYHHMAYTGGNLFALLVGWLYYAFMESSSRQATLGKMALGLLVTDEAGRRIGFGRATGRYFGMLVSWLTLTIGFMLAGWTARKQALHDMMAGALVVTGDGLKRQFAERSPTP